MRGSCIKVCGGIVGEEGEREKRVSQEGKGKCASR